MIFIASWRLNKRGKFIRQKSKIRCNLGILNIASYLKEINVSLFFQK